MFSTAVSNIQQSPAENTSPKKSGYMTKTALAVAFFRSSLALGGVLCVVSGSKKMS